jgi:hypothetical protein
MPEISVQFVVSMRTAAVYGEPRQTTKGAAQFTRVPAGSTHETRHVSADPPYEGPAWVALSMSPSCPEYAPPEIATSPELQEQS